MQSNGNNCKKEEEKSFTIFKKREKWIRENLTLDCVRKQKRNDSKTITSQDQTRTSAKSKGHFDI